MILVSFQIVEILKSFCRHKEKDEPEKQHLRFYNFFKFLLNINLQNIYFKLTTNFNYKKSKICVCIFYILRKRQN